MERERGTVKWYDKDKGYGFIISSGDKKDYFVHRNQIKTMEGYLVDGQVVEFEVGQGTKGPMAMDVRSSEEE